MASPGPDPALVVEKLRALPLLACLDGEALAALAGRTIPRSVPARHLLFAQGDPGDALYFILRGTVRLARGLANGREITLALRQEGTFIGDMALLDGQPRSASAWTQTSCDFLVLLRTDFEWFLDQHPAVARRMLGHLSLRLRAAAQQVEDLAGRTVRQRLASLLVQQALREGEPDGDGVLLPRALDYQVLTGLLGTIRESVSRAVSDLVEEGLVQKVGRRFRLVDLEGLQALVRE